MKHGVYKQCFKPSSVIERRRRRVLAAWRTRGRHANVPRDKRAHAIAWRENAILVIMLGITHMIDVDEFISRYRLVNVVFLLEHD